MFLLDFSRFDKNLREADSYQIARLVYLGGLKFFGMGKSLEMSNEHQK
jgi:hypothetical protein